MPYYVAAQNQVDPASPSGMFWDDLNSGLPFAKDMTQDSAKIQSDHWFLEPAFSYTLMPSETLLLRNDNGVAHYTHVRDSLTQDQVQGSYWRATVLNDIRYKRLLVRQVLLADSRFKTSKYYFWNNQRFAAGSISEAYGQLDWRYGFVRLGRLARNWGPFPDHSLLLSSNAQPFDGLEWQVHARWFEFRQVFASFYYANDLLRAVDEAREPGRFFAAHALNFMVGPYLTAGITEAILFSRSSAFPDLQYVNPFSIYTVSNTNWEGSGNLMLGFQWNLRLLGGKLRQKGQIIIDDIQVDNKGPGDQEPSHWGGDFGLSYDNFLPLAWRHSLTLEYIYLSRWLYTVADPNALAGERYMYRGKSLGYPDSDGDHLFLRADLWGSKYWLAHLALGYERQGINSPFSNWNTSGALGYRTETTFPSHTSEHPVAHTTTLTIGGRAYYKNFADLALDLDNRFFKNKYNVPGDVVYDPRISLMISLHYSDLMVPFKP